MKFSPIQALVAEHYNGGEYAYVTDTGRVEQVGDGLFTFLIDEAHHAQDPLEFVAMLLTAIEQLRSLANDIEGQVVQELRAPTKEFQITWSVDVNAESPEAAAILALAMQRDPESTATVFSVSDDAGEWIGSFDAHDPDNKLEAV